MTALANEPRPTTLLIGALGGEGGGLLTNWLVAAAKAGDLPVQSTSIPGVAQRTGARVCARATTSTSLPARRRPPKTSQGAKQSAKEVAKEPPESASELPKSTQEATKLRSAQNAKNR